MRKSITYWKGLDLTEPVYEGRISHPRTRVYRSTDSGNTTVYDAPMRTHGSQNPVTVGNQEFQWYRLSIADSSEFRIWCGTATASKTGSVADLCVVCCVPQLRLQPIAHPLIRRRVVTEHFSCRRTDRGDPTLSRETYNRAIQPLTQFGIVIWRRSIVEVLQSVEWFGDKPLYRQQRVSTQFIGSLATLLIQSTIN